MKFFTNKSIWSKIVIALVIVLIFQFIVTKPSLGADMVEFGGKLLTPIISLVLVLGDGLMAILHTSIMGLPMGSDLLVKDFGIPWWAKLVLFATAAIAIVVTGGWTALIATALVGWFTNAVYQTITEKNSDGKDSVVSVFPKDTLPETIALPLYSISPEEIFQGKILLFNVDFFGKPQQIYVEYEDGSESLIENRDESKPVRRYFYLNGENNNLNNAKEEDKISTSPTDIGAQMKSNISKWYVALRNIGLVMMLIVLLYVGIRMLLSTVASDKAKYKQMLQDWFMGVVILFSIHYIMVFANVIVNKITEIVSTSVESQLYFVAMEDRDDKGISNYLDEQGFSEGIVYETEGGNNKIVWPTNLMGSLRLRAQLATKSANFIGDSICFMVLVVFTCFFVFTYLKRVLYMAFLTLMAPLVAVTYPIDKLSDGKAQGFDKWFREYVFNLLIQPLHLLLYYILVTSAFELAGTNVIYSLVAIGFMIPAEKILRGFFGFEKSSTAPSMATGAALGMAAAHAFKPKPPKFGGSGAKGIGGGSDNSSVDNDTGTKTSAEGIDTNARMASLVAGNLDNNPEEDQTTQVASAKDNSNDISGESSKPIQAELLDTDNSRVGNVEVTERAEKENDNNAEINSNELEATISTPTNSGKRIIRNGYNKAKEKYVGSKADRFIASKSAKAWSSIKQRAKGVPGDAIRVLGKTAGAGVGATIGLVSGIAQGDFGKAMTNTAAGAATGAVAGKGMVNGAANRLDRRLNSRFPQETPDQAYNRVHSSARYDDLAKKEKWNKQKKELQQSMVANGISKKDAKEFTKEGGNAEYLWNHSVQDNKQLMASYESLNESYNNLPATEKERVDKMPKEEKAKWNEEQLKDVVAIAKTSKEMGNGYKGTKARKWEKEWAQRVQENGSITDPKQATEAGKQIVKRGVDFSKKMEKYR